VIIPLDESIYQGLSFSQSSHKPVNHVQPKPPRGYALALPSAEKTTHLESFLGSPDKTWGKVSNNRSGLVQGEHWFWEPDVHTIGILGEGSLGKALVQSHGQNSCTLRVQQWQSWGTTSLLVSAEKKLVCTLRNCSVMWTK